MLSSGIRGHFERVCRQPKSSKKQESGSNATQSDLDPVSRSYLFAAQFSSGPAKAERQRVHRQRQRQRERALEAGLSPNSARKARRDKAKEEATHKLYQKLTQDAENSFVRSLRHTNRKLSTKEYPSPAKTIVIPHMIWNGIEFCKEAPEPPTAMKATISLMHSAHQSFGRKWTNMPDRPTDFQIETFTDTCAQTYTSGPEILQQLQCPTLFLIPTSHGIHGITEKPLEIMGALLLLIYAGGHQTRQVVYVAKNINGLYLSQTALKDL